jgi:hypothetical protein
MKTTGLQGVGLAFLPAPSLDTRCRRSRQRLQASGSCRAMRPPPQQTAGLSPTQMAKGRSDRPRAMWGLAPAKSLRNVGS